MRLAQDEILVHTAKRGAAALDWPALIAGGALFEHIHGARRGWGRRRAGRQRRRGRTLHRCELTRLRQVVEERWRLWIVGYQALDARLREAVCVPHKTSAYRSSLCYRRTSSESIAVAVSHSGRNVDSGMGRGLLTSETSLVPTYGQEMSTRTAEQSSASRVERAGLPSAVGVANLAQG